VVQGSSVEGDEQAEAEVVRFCRELIAFDTTNTGVPVTTAGELEAARYVRRRLTEVGLRPELRVVGETGK